MQAAGRRYIVHGSKKNEFTIWNLSDLHLMNKACAEGQLKKDIKRIAGDPNAFWLGGGDYCECIGHVDKRFDPDSVAPWVSVKDLNNIGKVGMTKVRDYFLPIKDKCLGLLKGNHELHYERVKTQGDLHQWLCDEIEAPNLEYCSIFDLVFCRSTRIRTPYLVLNVEEVPYPRDNTAFRFFVHHGAGFATTPGGSLTE